MFKKRIIIADKNTERLFTRIVKYLNRGTVGEIKMFAFETPPIGWFECDGSAKSRTTYAELFARIGITHGQGDGSTTFNVPNYRGLFLRGWDNASGTDPDAASRTAMATGGVTGDNVGSIQADMNKAHIHQLRALQNASGTGAFDGDAAGTDIATSSSGGNESRPRNANVMYCIKH